MPNKKLFLSYLSFLYLTSISLFSQAPATLSAKETISHSFERYFELERENIHVQFDKNVFITNESVWFKGYVFNKKLNLPFYETTNVYVQLIDESGEVIANQLLYAMSGFFSGKINLNKKFKSGYYYLQFYTNWMNNFEEDESFVQRIKVKNESDNDFVLGEYINPKKINVEFYPEGGNYITNASNVIGVKITDSNGIPIPDCTLEIQDSNNTVQKSITMNTFGMGKFEFTPNGQYYKGIVTYNSRKFEYDLPVSKSDGIALELNNYIFDNRTLVKIKYNKDYEKTLKNKTLYLVIQKNEKTNIIDIKLNAENGNEFYFSNALLFKGVNSVRVIDSDLNEMAQRMLFVAEDKTSRVSINPAIRTNETISLSGNSNWRDACISVAVLPSKTKLTADDNIITSLQLNAYLTEKLRIKRDYFDDSNRSKKYELDLMLLTQKSNKYDWNSIKNKSINPLYTFEKGLDIKGTINQTTADVRKSRIQLKNIFSDVLASTDTIQKNEFYFKNTTVSDSLLVTANLIDKKDRSSREMSYHLNIINKNKKFNKNYLPTPYEYPDKSVTDAYLISETPKFEGHFIMLEEVEVIKTKLKREKYAGNSYLKGFKVGVDVSENTDILQFIEQNGFNVNRNIGSISINGRQKTSLNGPPTTPVVFIDGRELWNFEELYGLRMLDMDEVYISSTAMVPSIKNKQGIIKMYRKQGVLTVTESKNKPKVLTGGFEPISPFKNADYLSEYTTGFENYGLIDWDPWILTDTYGNVKLTIPNKNHKSIKVFIEGMTIDGTLISEIREVILSE